MNTLDIVQEFLPKDICKHIIDPYIQKLYCRSCKGITYDDRSSLCNNCLLPRFHDLHMTLGNIFCAICEPINVCSGQHVNVCSGKLEKDYDKLNDFIDRFIKYINEYPVTMKYLDRMTCIYLLNLIKVDRKVTRYTLKDIKQIHKIIFKYKPSNVIEYCDLFEGLNLASSFRLL